QACSAPAETRPQGPRCRSSTRIQETYAGDFSCLLRLDGNVKRKEQSAKRKDSDFSIHLFLSLLRSTLDIRSFSLNHSVRSRQHVGRYYEPDLFGVFKFDDKLNFLGFFYGKVRGLRVFKILADNARSPLFFSGGIVPIRNDPPRLDIRPIVEHCR